MAPRRRSASELSALVHSIPKSEIPHFMRSLSDEERYALYAFLIPLDPTVPAEYHLLTHLDALSRDEREIVMACLVELVNIDAAKGCQHAQSLSLRLKDTLSYLHGGETPFDQQMNQAITNMKLDPLDIDPIREDAQRTACTIIQRWKLLYSVVQSYEQLIQTRWSNATRNRKREILLSAWPDMAEGHRPDLSNYLRLTTGKPVPADFPLYAWPYINQEDLLRPKALMVFINSRGRHHPVNFAWSDLEWVPLHKIPKQALAARTTRFTMNFTGSEDPMKYAEFKEWTDEASAAEAMKAGRAMHPDNGIQILDLQAPILAFLLDCITGILHDKDLRRLPPTLPEPPKLSDQVTGFRCMEIIAREAPYRLPCQPDLSRLSALCGAEKQQAIDHVWALHEDPAYFASMVKDFHEHRCELIPGLCGSLNANASDFPLYNKAVRHMATDAHCNVFLWDHIYEHISEIRKLWLKYSNSISVERDIPQILHRKLVEFRFLIEQITADKLSDMGQHFRGMPSLRAYHYLANTDKPRDRFMHIQDHDWNGADASIQHLLRLKAILCHNDKGMREVFTVHTILDELECLLQSNSRAKSLVTGYVARHLAELSVLAECLHQLHQLQPWARKIEEDVEERKFALSIEYERLTRPWALLLHYGKKFETKPLFTLCYPRDGKFEYPVHEQPTQSKVDKMRSAEAALDAFWRAADTHWLGLMRTTPSALIKHLMGERTLRRTPPWKAPHKAIKPDSGPATPSTLIDSFSKHSHDITKQVTGTFTKNAQPVKQKTKTKGTPTLEVEHAAVPEPHPLHEVTSQYTLKVDKRALKVFRALFHSPDSPNQPGEIAWTDLLHALVSAGFGAEKLRSSAWHFTPPSTVSERAIQLHEPHPSNKLPFVLARHYGRRLNIAYQWTIESFELA